MSWFMYVWNGKQPHSFGCGSKQPCLELKPHKQSWSEKAGTELDPRIVNLHNRQHVVDTKLRTLLANEANLSH